MRYTIIAHIREPRKDYNRKDIAVVEADYQHEAKSAYKDKVAPAIVKTFLEVYQSTEAEIYLWDLLHPTEIKM